MTIETELIESLGYVLKESNTGKNEFRSWTTYFYIHPITNRFLIYNDSDEVLIVRDSNRRIILEGRFKLNQERLIKL